MVNFRIDVVISTKSAEAGTKRVSKQLDIAAARANNLRRSLRRAFLILGGGTLLLRSIRTLAQFDQAMSTVQAVTEATEEEFAKLRDTARDLGITTRFTATQAADAMVKLARAGFTVNEALISTEQVLRLAQAGGLGLAQSADIAASTLRGFRLEAEEMSRVTDVLTKAANSANTTVAQLGEGLKFVAPIAAGIGVPLEQTAAAMGSLADSGLKATLAGTGLRRIFAELEAPTGATVDILQSLGLSIDQVRFSNVGLIQSLETLRQAGVDTGLALQIFGQRGGPAFEVLVNNIPSIRALTNELNNSAGEANRVAKVMDDNLNGALLRTRSALEGLLIALGDAGVTEGFINSLEAITSALRFLASNSDTVLSAVQALAIVGLFGKLIPALTATTLAANATTFSLSLLSKTVFLATAAAATVAVLAFRKMGESLAEIEAAQESAIDAARFNKFGAALRQNANELRNLAAIQKRQGSLSEGQAARKKQLEDRTAALSAALRQQSEDTQALIVAQAASKPSVENTLKSLDRQLSLLRLTNRESEIQIQLQSEVDRLLQAGIVPDVKAKKEIESRLSMIKALEDQKRVLEEIRGPQREMEQDITAIEGLLASGAVTAEEYRIKLEEIKDELTTGFESDPLEDQIQSLQDANGLLGIQLRFGERRADMERQLLDLKRAGAISDTTAFTAARTRIEKELAQRDELNNKLKLQRLLERESDKGQRRLDSLARQLDTTDRLVRRGQDLERLYEQQPALVDEINGAFDRMELKSLEASTALEDGFTRAFIKIRQEAEDFAAVGESVVGVFADSATDALTEFAQTGKLNFKELANSIVNDLIKIIARLLVVQSLNAVFGGPAANIAGGALPSFGGARAEGGTVQPGRSFMVGENGPETFVPGKTGTIVPAAAQAAPPEVNLQVVNVQSEDDIPNAINEGGADNALLNFLHRNKDKVKQVVN